MASNRYNPLKPAYKLPMADSSSSSAAPAASSAASQAPTSADQKPRPPPRKRKGHRGGKKKRPRRKSFAALTEDSHDEMHEAAGERFYKMPTSNLSGTSLDSETLLDHREQKPMRIRRSSTIVASSPFKNPFSTPGGSRLRVTQAPNSGDERGDVTPWDETAPLLSESVKYRGSPTNPSSYGAADARAIRNRSRRASSGSSRTKLTAALGIRDAYDVNHPPSVPASPAFGPTDRPDMTFADVMIRDDISLSGSPHRSIDDDEALSGTEGPVRDHARRMTSAAAADVCFPGLGMSELGEEDTQSRDPDLHQFSVRRRRAQWPDLSILEEWRHFEKEDRSEEVRVKKITEPQLINGRLRPVRKGWFQTDEDAPYRFTYFNEEFQSTIHSQTISELVQPGSDFRELFIPDPRILSDDESDDDDTASLLAKAPPPGGGDGESKISTRQPSVAESRRDETASPSRDAAAASDRATPVGIRTPDNSVRKEAQPGGPETKPKSKPVRYGDRPVWWLDVLCPTEAEMKVISKAFGIHPLTAEDIMVQEAREKVELFRHYYFVNYRTFDQDITSENYLEPVDMYVVVFREGLLSFHFSMTPHPANVRRRIRQLRDYLILSSDWISYAIIDDITDVFQPLIQHIEDEVDEIDDQILQLHSSADKRLKDEKMPPRNDDSTAIVDSGDMLRRVGDCRKRVMSLYRLLGNKADVIKGFAKRCNERWEVAPRSEIGLYLGDIQDHIITMTSNLGHYEKILARSHGNYLAQINIRMNERQEQTADVLGKLTVLGTIVLPMNVITGLWGMNVWVPGQEYEGDLAWFAWITAGLICFGLACYMIAKRVYKIV
ncbi:metal ion transporter [Tolypocladium capitatum]|uniref:Metal ion transporter n=1 Tax=Tolypocladium capitatum TaxID=45235 RepID=A0A2K3QG94_9HYPO|nr:metal ion transporter [Tolypocladium capitatum]